VAGEPESPAGEWRDFVRKIPGEARGEIVPADHPDAREAVLRYRTLGQTPHGAWLEIELETGRMHQIRIQAGARGLAVLGDAMYGSQVAFGVQHEDARLRGIALHARHLAFDHPMTRERVNVTAPLADPWRELIGPAADGN
jgi:23S rRNA pseudouridine1911/1915/1917 synthase